MKIYYETGQSQIGILVKWLFTYEHSLVFIIKLPFISFWITKRDTEFESMKRIL